MNKYFITALLCGTTSLSFLFSQQQTFRKNSKAQENLKNKSVITPSASPVVSDGVNFFFNADLIYWTAREEGLSFATLNSNSDQTPRDSNYITPQGRSLFVKNKYSPGFKVGAGTYSKHDGWDVVLEYTWFRTSPASSKYEGQGLTPRELINSFAVNELPPFEPVDSNERTAKGKWRFRFNNFDLEVGRNFFISHYLTLRPHIGLKGGWQRQTFNSYLTFNDIVTVAPWTEANYNIHLKQKQWNIGLRTGMDTAWMFTKNWSIFGDFAVSTLWNEFRVSRIDKATTQGAEDPVDNASNFQTYNILNRSHILTPVFEFLLGLRFDLWFSDEHYKFRLQAGWENQVWFNQNNLDESFYRKKIFNANSTNLIMQGLTLEAKLDF